MKISHLILLILLIFSRQCYSQEDNYCSALQEDLNRYASKKDDANFLKTVNKITLYCNSELNPSKIDSLIQHFDLKIISHSSQFKNLKAYKFFNVYQIKEDHQILLENLLAKDRKSDKIDTILNEKREQLKTLGYYDIRFNHEYFITDKDKVTSIHNFNLTPIITNLSGVNWISFNSIESSDQFIKIHKEGKTAIFDLKNKTILADRFTDDLQVVIKNKKILFFLYKNCPVDVLGNYIFGESKFLKGFFYPNSTVFIIADRALNEEALYNINLEKVSKTYNSIWQKRGVDGLFDAIRDNDTYLINRYGVEVKKYHDSEKIKALSDIYGTYYIHSFENGANIINDNLNIINSSPYQTITEVSIDKILVCKKYNGEFHFLDFEFTILATLKAKSIIYALNEDNDIIYIVDNNNTYYIVDVFGKQQSEVFQNIDTLLTNNSLKVFTPQN